MRNFKRKIPLLFIFLTLFSSAAFSKEKNGSNRSNDGVPHGYGGVELGMTLEERVQTSSIQHAAQAEDITDGGRFPAEIILRGKWYFK